VKLAQLQQSFQTQVLQGGDAIAGELSADERFTLAVRLGVYTHAYAARLIEALAETFPAVQAALGERQFARQVGDFVRARPSRFRSVRDYGEQLSAWLTSRLGGPRAQGIADLARFEWAMAGAFDAADDPALEPQQLASVEPARWPSLQFTFAPSLRRLSVTSNCLAWWKFACAEQLRPSRWRSTCPQQWLIWRQELAVFYRRLPQAEARALDAALAGRSFGQLCEQLSGAAQAAQLLQGWFNAGLVVGISPGGSLPAAPDQ
jgi:hypothetical protein